MKERVRITDVSPRDGLQNEAGIIPTADKVRLIELLCATGVDEIEVTSFVSPKWVPQLGDAAEVVLAMSRYARWHQVSGYPLLSALIPNMTGFSLMEKATDQAELDGLQDLERAMVDEGPQELRYLKDEPLPEALGRYSVFMAASETFSKKNTNCTIEESLERIREIASGSGKRFWLSKRAYVSCVIACPFEGPIAPSKVADIVAKLVELDFTDIDLGDTIGAGDWLTTTQLLETVQRRVGKARFDRQGITLHLHDTFGRAVECVHAALDLGVRSFDGSVAGLGGCPYASKKLPDGTIQRAPGNISTELLVQTIEDAGYETGVDRDALAKAAAFAREIVAKSRAGA